MPSNQTPSYGLSQWVREDKVLMEDFNADNAKIDAALKAAADTRASLGEVLAKKGNCRIVYGSYTGNNLAGEANPTTLTFDGKPLALFILPPNMTSGYPTSMFLLRGANAACSSAHSPNSGNQVTWGENSVSWYSYNNTPEFQFSFQQSYPYVALLAADE